jgi:hypothetical protein
VDLVWALAVSGRILEAPQARAQVGGRVLEAAAQVGGGALAAVEWDAPGKQPPHRLLLV